MMGGETPRNNRVPGRWTIALSVVFSDEKAAGHGPLSLHRAGQRSTRNAAAILLSTGLLIGANWSSAASERCDANSKAGEVCLCRLSELHPTQATVGMLEVRIRAEKLKSEMQNRSERDFLKHLKKHDRIEPVVVGPAGTFYITDHHHLARALQEIGATTTYCRIVENLSNSEDDAFWKYMHDNNEVYLRDAHGDVIAPSELPSKIVDLQDDPFRSLAGAVRQACGFAKQPEGLPSPNYLEFAWAEYFRSNWPKTGIPAAGINQNFDSATQAALKLATEPQASALPGYTGKNSCQ
jgi:hypothetical protein